MSHCIQHKPSIEGKPPLLRSDQNVSTDTRAGCRSIAVINPVVISYFIGSESYLNLLYRAKLCNNSLATIRSSGVLLEFVSSGSVYRERNSQAVITRIGR